MSDLVKISKIILKVNDKEIELSLSEAKQLLNILTETFKASKPGPILKEKECIPVYPWWMEPRRNYYPDWKITWGGGTAVIPDTVQVSDDTLDKLIIYNT